MKQKWDFDYVPDSAKKRMMENLALIFYRKVVSRQERNSVRDNGIRSCNPNALTCPKHVQKSTAPQLWQNIMVLMYLIKWLCLHDRDNVFGRTDYR